MKALKIGGVVLVLAAAIGYFAIANNRAGQSAGAASTKGESRGCCAIR